MTTTNKDLGEGQEKMLKTWEAPTLEILSIDTIRSGTLTGVPESIVTLGFSGSVS